MSFKEIIFYILAIIGIGYIIYELIERFKYIKKKCEKQALTDSTINVKRKSILVFSLPCIVLISFSLMYAGAFDMLPQHSEYLMFFCLPGVILPIIFIAAWEKNCDDTKSYKLRRK